MSLSEEQFREQLVDYLYGELEEAQRAAFEAALTSPERRAELESMRATLRAARTGLSALHEEPPARLRAAILEAAREPRAKDAPRTPWYRRGTTLAPLLAAAAALTFAVLAPRPEPQPDYASEAAPVSAPAAAPAPVAPSEDRLATPQESKGRLEQPPQKRESSRRGAAKPSAPRRELEDHAEATPVLRERDDEVPGYAQPPEGWTGLGASSSGGAGPVAPANKASRAHEEARASAPPASRPAPAKPAASAAAPAASPSADSVAEKSDQVAAPRAPDAAVERAEAHVKARRWSEAVIAYRELMQRYPNDARYAAWRTQLTEAASKLSAVPQVP